MAVVSTFTPPPTVVVLHAHPDDESIFTGIALRRLADAGARVVLVSATSGEAGQVCIGLPAHESLRERRVAELERACALLGVSRLVLLGYSDSGAHPGPYAPGTLGATDPRVAARALARILVEEAAEALVHYDDGGIYGHVDHVQVHRVGAEAARLTGVATYEATVDHAALRRGPHHVVQEAAGDDRDLGVPTREISLTLSATPSELLAKMAAMTAHASQIGPRWLDPLAFAPTYGREWFVRRGAAGAVDVLLAGDGRGSGVSAAPRRPRQAALTVR